MTKSKPPADSAFLFQLDVMVTAKTNGEALEHLLQVMNNGGFDDFRITSGIQLGSSIEKALAASRSEAPPASPAPPAKPVSPAAPGKSAPPASESAGNPLESRIQSSMAAKRLIRLNVNRGRGVKLSIPCRIVGFDSDKGHLSVYHVDEKQVYTFNLNEIDDFIDQ